jgi:DNA topoisomerase-2
MTKKYVEKHIPAKSKKVSETVLLLTEGDSAAGMGQKVRDVYKHGFFPMRGCVKNTYGVKDKEILENKELNDIMTILGLKFNMTSKEIEEDLLYGKIGIMADGDLDGSHINSLVINFFSKWTELFQQNKIFIVTSPRYIFTKNKGKKNEERIYCYDKNEYETVRDNYKGWELRYIKGLGSLRPKEYRDVLDNTDRWLCVELDDMKALEIMFSDNVEERRKIMGI